MGLFDSFQNKMNSFLDRLPGNKRANDYDDQGYQDYQEYDNGYGQGQDYYQEQPYYGSSEQPAYGYEEPIEETTQYESTYTSGSGYVVGARPTNSSRKKGIGGFFDRIGGRQENNGSYAPPPQQQQRASNVIPMNQYDQQDDWGYQNARSASSASARQQYYQPEPPQEPAPAAPRAAPRSASTMIYLVRRLEDAEEIISYMVDGGNVIVNMEEIDESLKRRVLDIISGAAFSLEGSIKRISYRTYFVALNGEEVVSNISMREQGPPDDDDGYRQGRDYGRY